MIVGAIEIAGDALPWIGTRTAMACPVCAEVTLGTLQADLSAVCVAPAPAIGPRTRGGCGARLHLCRWCGLRRVSDNGGEMACAACGRRWEAKA